MSTIFSRIFAGEIPGTFVWADDDVVAMATIEPVRPGHVLVIPRQEIAKYTDVEPQLFAHAMNVAQVIGRAQEKAFGVPRAIVSILGFEVPHTHIHVIPATDETAAQLHDLSMAPREEIDAAMEKLRDALIELGYQDYVPTDLHSLAKS